MRIPTTFLLAGAILFTGFARGEPLPGDASIVWECGYEPSRAAMACRVDMPPLEEGPMDAEALKGYPALLRTIRLAPGRLVGEMIYVPLYAPPIDMKLAVRAARAALCGGVKGCRVDYVGVLHNAEHRAATELSTMTW